MRTLFIALALPLFAGCGGAVADAHLSPTSTATTSSVRRSGRHFNASQLATVSQEQQRIIDATERNVESALRLTSVGRIERTERTEEMKKPAKHSKHAKQAKHAETEAPVPLSQAVASIRARKLPLTLAPVPEKSAEEKGILMLDYQAFKASLEKVPPSAWKTDREGLMAATQNFGKVSSAVNAASLAVVQTSILTPSVNIRGMIAIAHLKIERGAWSSSSWTAEDRAIAKRLIGDGKRSATIGAIATALVAGYQGVCNDNQDPAALDVFADKTLAAFPVKVEVSDEEAAAYVDGLDTSKLEDTHARYEAMLRETYGDETFEKKYRKNLDESFKDLDAAAAKGAAPPRQSAASHAPPVSLRAPGTKAAAAGLLDQASDLLPADSSVRQTLKGVSALVKGDTKGALKAALALVPLPGPAKDGINLVLGAFKLI